MKGHSILITMRLLFATFIYHAGKRNERLGPLRRRGDLRPRLDRHRLCQFYRPATPPLAADQYATGANPV
jgi:hypothetical protein